MGLHAVFTMQDPVNSFILLIEEIDDGPGIVLGGGSIDINCVKFGHFLEELQAVRPDVELELVAFDGEGDIGLLIREDGVDQSLVKI